MVKENISRYVRAVPPTSFLLAHGGNFNIDLNNN